VTNWVLVHKEHTHPREHAGGDTAIDSAPLSLFFASREHRGRGRGQISSAKDLATAVTRCTECSLETRAGHGRGKLEKLT
jgi:hypothetical protein